jgi:hypothetical protein
MLTSMFPRNVGHCSSRCPQARPNCDLFVTCEWSGFGVVACWNPVPQAPAFLLPAHAGLVLTLYWPKPDIHLLGGASSCSLTGGLTMSRRVARMLKVTMYASHTDVDACVVCACFPHTAGTSKAILGDNRSLLASRQSRGELVAAN